MTSPAPLRIAEGPWIEAVDRLLRIAARSLGAPFALLSVVDAEGRLFERAFGFEPHPAPGRQRPAPSRDPFRRLEDAAASPLAAHLPALSGLGVRAGLGVPVIVGEQVVGALGVFDVGLRPSADSDVALLADCAAAIVHEFEARATEQALHERDQQIATLLAVQPEAVFLLDPSGRVTYANDAAKAISAANDTGDPTARAYDDPAWTLSTVEGAPIPVEDLPFVRVLRTGEPVFDFEFAAELPDGRRQLFSSNAAPLRGPAGEIGSVVVSVRDVTARKLAERRLEESEQRFRELAENITDVFWITDPEKREMIYVSPAYEKVWGRPAEALYRSPGAWQGAIHPDDRARIALALPKQAAGGYDETYRILQPGGELRWIRDRAFPVHDREGRLVRIVGAARDVTEHKLLEEQLLHAQKLEAVGQLAGGIAHDFNNLLTAIQGNAELLLEGAGDDAALREGLEEIDQATVRAASLTRQLLAFSRRQVVQPRVVDPNAVVRDMEKLLRRLIGENIELVTSLDRAPGAVLVDKGQLEQVLMNLVVNARDAIGPRGRVSIETRRVSLGEPDAAQMPDLRPGEHLVLSVRDDGCGMDPSVLARVFEPFFTTKETGRGTGLGLATVYGIVRQSGGHVEVESAPGKGSTFSVHLRVVGAPGESDAGRPARAPARPGAETVLVVEDEEPVRALARRVLERAGYRVLVARHGPEALDLCTSHAGAIHLMVTDVVMPGMSGRELAERAARLRPDMRILYVSGYTDDAVLRHGILRAEVDLVDKPFFPATLTQAVRKALGSAAAP